MKTDAPQPPYKAPIEISLWAPLFPNPARYHLAKLLFTAIVYVAVSSQGFAVQAMPHTCASLFTPRQVQETDPLFPIYSESEGQVWVKGGTPQEIHYRKLSAREFKLNEDAERFSAKWSQRLRGKTEKLISTSVGGVASPAPIGKRETEKFIYNLFAGFLNRIGEPVGAQTMLRVSANRLTADSLFSHLVDFLEIRALDITAQDQLEADLDLLFASIGSPDQRLALSASYQRYNGDVQRAVLPGLDIDFFAVINRSTGTALLFILFNKSGPSERGH